MSTSDRLRHQLTAFRRRHPEPAADRARVLRSLRRLSLDTTGGELRFIAPADLQPVPPLRYVSPPRVTHLPRH